MISKQIIIEKLQEIQKSQLLEENMINLMKEMQTQIKELQQENEDAETENERLMKGVDREIEVDDKLELIGAIGASAFTVVFTFGMFFLWLMGVG